MMEISIDTVKITIKNQYKNPHKFIQKKIYRFSLLLYNHMFNKNFQIISYNLRDLFQLKCHRAIKELK
jgi:hypothetical protein